MLVILLAGIPRLPAADEKHLTVFDSQGRYNVAVSERNSHDYVPLRELLDPLGEFNAKVDGNRYRARFKPLSGKERELEFDGGKIRGKVGGAEIVLPDPLLIEGGAALVPAAASAQLLTAFGISEIEFHPQGRRLLIGNVAVRFQTELQKGAESKLVLHFTGPVDPTIATEAGKLRMSFHRAPVSGSGTQNFDDKLISSATYSESNGEAEITVNGTGPLMASFSPDARTITIMAPPTATAPAPAAAPTATAPAAASPPTTPAPAVPAAPAQPTPATPSRPRFVVAIDAAHGGSETGAMLPGQVAEKEVTLGFARRLQAEFEKQGIATVMLREGDAAIGEDQRAIASNTARSSLYIVVHVGAEGRGVRLYTARMAPPPATRPLFLPWATAQASFLDASRAAAGSIAAEMSKRQMPVAAYSAVLPPLNNVAGPAVAIELAPLDRSPQSVSAAAYQQAVSSAVVAGVAAVRSNLEAAR